MRRLSLAFVLFTACAAGEGQQPPQAAPKPFDVKALLARERELLPTQKIDGAKFTAETEGTDVSVKAHDGMQEVVIGLGTQIGVTCYVSEEPIDVGSTFTAIVDESKKALTIEATGLDNVKVVAGKPLVELGFVYSQQRPEGKVLGTAKMWFSPKDHYYCIHDELGYQKTFERVVEQFATSFKSKDAKETPAARTEVTLLTVQEKLVGYSYTQRLTSAKGVTEVETELLFVPRSATEFVAHDVARVTSIDTKGEWLERRVLKVQNGEIDTDIKLTRKKGTEYHYAGTFSGKKLEGDVKAPRPLLGWETQRAEITKTLLTGKKASLTYPVWSVDQDPTAIKDEVLTKDGERRLKVTSGELVIAVDLDQKGDPESVEVPLGKLTMRGKRAYLSAK